MVSVVTVRVLLGRNLQTDLDALDKMVVDSLVGSGDNALSGGDDKEREGNDESMVEEIESQVRDWSNGSSTSSNSRRICFSFHARRRRT